MTDQKSSKTTVSQAEFARLVNVNRSSVYRALEKGRLTGTPDGQIELDADARDRDAIEFAALTLWDGSGSSQPHHRARMEQIREQTRQRQAMKTAKDSAQPAQDAPKSLDGMDALNLRLKRAETEKREHEAEMARMDREYKERSLLNREAVEFALRDYTAKTAAQWGNLADRLAPVLHPLETVEEVRATLAEAADQALREVHAALNEAAKLAAEVEQ